MGARGEMEKEGRILERYIYDEVAVDKTRHSASRSSNNVGSTERPIT